MSFFSATKSILEGDIFSSKPYFQMDVSVFKRPFVDDGGFVPGYILTVEEI
jgi:hypothetical protein